MEPNFFIKYSGRDNEELDIELELLGESIVGFSKVVQEIFKVSDLNAEVTIKATNVSKGSIIVEIAIEYLTSAPFDSAKDFLDFAMVAGEIVYKEVAAELSNDISNILEAERNLNDFANDFPVRYDFLKYVCGTFLVGSIAWIRKQKNKPTVDDENGNKLPKKYAPRFKKIINSKKFQKPLKPIIENQADSITVSTDRNFTRSETIDSNNFEDYLSDDLEILPDFTNGSFHNLTGEIVSLQCSRGETMKFKIDRAKIPADQKKHSLLIALPKDEKKTYDYLEFYNKDVWVKVEIVRHSMFKKPKLVIHEIGLEQSSID